MQRILNSAIRWSVLATVVGVVSACGGVSLEDRFAADPALEENPPTFGNSSESNQSDRSDPESPAEVPSRPLAERSEGIPSEIPLYPQAQLVDSSVDETGMQGELRLTSADPEEAVVRFYEQEFQSEDWQWVTPPEQAQGETLLTARRDDLEVTVLVAPTDGTGEMGEDNTEMLISYETLQGFSQGDLEQGDLETEGVPSQETESVQTDSGEAMAFSDLDRIPEPMRQYVEDLAALGVLTPASESGKTTQGSGTQFAPSEPITRREFARWLLQANNQLYRDRPGQQIRPVPQADPPAFQDIPPSDPDFAAIQGLAEAGIIPSRLTGDATVVRFRPDAPLTREDLLRWKVPLDLRGALPAASVEAVKEAWGFQDASQIDPQALSAVLADFSNGEQANLRRILGYTRLLQPKKTVTRAEAAAALWSFGSQGEAITAEEVLRVETAEES